MNETILYEAFQQAQSNPMIGFKIFLAFLIPQFFFFLLVTIFKKEHGKRMIKEAGAWILFILAILVADAISAFIIAPYLF